MVSRKLVTTVPPAPFLGDSRIVCRRYDPEVFQPPTYKKADPRVMEAKRLCGTCPLEDECRDWAVAREEPAGIWGGTTPTERKKLRHPDHIFRDDELA